MSDELKLHVQLMGAIMGMDGRYQATFQRLQAQVEAQDYPGAIRSATECIEIVEGLFRDYQEAFAVDPQATTNYSGDLVTHYGTRGAVRLDYARAGGPNPETLLKLAEVDIDKALSFPPACYRDPDARSNLIKAKKLIQETKRSGGVSAAKSTGCLVLVAACGFAGLLGVILA